MKATTQKPELQFRQGLFQFLLSTKTLLAAFLLLFGVAAKASGNPYFASKDYFHWADKLNAWDNGNLSKNKSGYKEGDVVAHSYVPNGLVTGTEYTVQLKYDYYLGTKDAGGFSDLVWDPALFSKSPTGQQNEGTLTGTNKTFGSINYFATNLTLTSVTALADQSSGNTTLKVWEIKFTYTGSTGSDAALYFGLKLAVKDEVNPPSNGSAAWSGASLQTYLDPSSDPGTRSLQIDPGAIQSACPNPPTVTAGSYGPLCSNGSPILLGGTPAGGTWTGTGVSGDATNGYYFDPSVGTQTLIYTFTDANGCSNSDETTITVNQAPTVTAGSYGPLCSNASPISLVGSPSGGIWSGTGVSGSQANGYTFNPSAGTQTLTYSYTDGNGCSGSAQTTITVNNAPTVSAGSYGPLCSNGSPILLGGTPAGGTWTGTGVSGDATNGYYFDPSVGTQTLTYSYTDPATKCSGTAQVSITVNQAPTVTAGSYGPLCSNASPISLAGNPSGGVWSGTGVSGSQANGYTFNPSAGTQTLTYSYTDGNGCSGSAQTTITVNTPPTCSITQTVPASGNPKVGTVASFSAPAGYNYAWTISSVGNTANASIVNNTASSQTVQVSTTMAGSYTLQLTLTDAATNCSSSCSKSVTVDPVGPSITYTQGFFGNTNGKACNGKNSYMIMNDAVAAAGGSIRFGNATDSRSFTLYQLDVNNTSKSNIYKMLPGGTTPAVLKAAVNYDPSVTTASYGNAKTWPAVPMSPSINNILLAQTMALRFSIYYSGSVGKPISGIVLTGNVLTFAKPTTACGSTYQTTGTTKTIPCSVFTYISNMVGGATIGNLYTLANQVLGGEVTTVSPSDVNTALNTINTGFDGGATIIGVSNTCSSVTVVSKKTEVVVESMQVKAITVSAYPNPFTDHIRFTIQAPRAGRATLEVYNMLGQKVGVPFEGQLSAGETRSVDYTAPVNQRSNLIYLLRMNGEQASGKLMSTKQ